MSIVGLNNLNDISITIILRSSKRQLIIHDSDNTGIVEQIIWERRALQPFSVLRVTVRSKHIINMVENGDFLILQANIYDVDSSSEFKVINKFYIGGISSTDSPLEQVTLVCRDFMTFAWSSKHSEKILSQETASSFVKRIANKYSIPIDNIVDTQTTLLSHVFERESIYNMWLSVFTLEMIESKIPYRIFMTHIGLKIERIISNKRGWLFEVDKVNSNIFTTDRTISVFNDKFANIVRGYDSISQEEGILGSLRSLTTEQSDLSTNRRDDDSVSKYGAYSKDLNLGNLSFVETLRRVDTLFRPDPIDEIELRVIGFFGPTIYDSVYVINPIVGASSQYVINRFRLSITMQASILVLSLGKVRDVPEKVLQEIEAQSGILGQLQQIP